MIFHDEDAVVRRVPTGEELEALRERFPDAEVTLSVKEGDRLSELRHQGSYRYIIAKAYLGASDREELARTHRALEALPFGSSRRSPATRGPHEDGDAAAAQGADHRERVHPHPPRATRRGQDRDARRRGGQPRSRRPGVHPLPQART